MKTINSAIFMLSMLICSTMMAQVGNNGNNNSDGQTQRRDIVNDGPTMQIPTPEITISVPPNPPGPPLNTERQIFWVHGLGGNEGSWIDAATASATFVTTKFVPRLIFSNTYLSYTQGGDAFGAGLQLGTQILEAKLNTPTFDRNFIIAHSQGGIVSRALLHENMCWSNKPIEDFAYRGIVTFGTPNQGARVINNKLMFEEMSSDMCESLGGGKIQEALTFDFKGFTFQKVVNIQELCDQFSGGVVPLVTEFQTPEITKSYAVGYPHINTINAGCPNRPDFVSFPKVAFYGVEPSQNLMLRTLMYFYKSCNDSDYFEANNDNDLIVAFDKLRMNYLAKTEEYKSKYEDSESKRKKWCAVPSWTLFGGPSILFGGILAVYCEKYKAEAKANKNIFEAYKKANPWFDRFDDQYKAIIGSKGVVKTTKKYCVCKNEQTGQKTETPIIDDSECDPNTSLICFVQNKIVITKWEKESDGVVLAESASNIPFATAPPQRMISSSHMQMRNDENTRTALNLIYNGETDEFFKTIKK